MSAGATLPLPELERLLEEACGMAPSPGARHAVGGAFAQLARERGLPEEALLRRLRARDPASVAALVELAVVGETYFFRHPEQLEALARRCLVPAPAGRPLHLWSAGCASGEEPATLAMMLAEAGRGPAGDRIVATDVSARALAAARAGLYGEWSLRRLGPARRARFFEPAGGRLALEPAVRERVEYRVHNLVRDEPPGLGFDAILCRNVLIYFTPERALATLRRLAGALAPGGWLLLGPVEAPLAAPLPLEQVEVPGALLLRRPEAAGWRPVASAPAPPAATAGAEAAPAGFPAACAAARRGELALAERLAAEAAARDLDPRACLLQAVTAEARGDDRAALEAVHRALSLEPGLAQAHAALVPLYERLGRPAEAARARREALEALRGVAAEADLPGVEPISAGALRQALGAAAENSSAVAGGSCP